MRHPAELLLSIMDRPAYRFGGTTVFADNRVGDMFDTVSGFGNVPSGDYIVVDLSGRVFVDRNRRHRVNLRLENLFDEVYATRHGRGFGDFSTTPFLVHALGVPRTFHMSYSFSVPE